MEPKQLFEACSALSEERHPSPDPEQWQSITDPHARTLAALTALYRTLADNGVDPDEAAELVAVMVAAVAKSQAAEQ